MAARNRLASHYVLTAREYANLVWTINTPITTPFAAQDLTNGLTMSSGNLLVQNGQVFLRAGKAYRMAANFALNANNATDTLQIQLVDDLNVQIPNTPRWQIYRWDSTATVTAIQGQTCIISPLIDTWVHFRTTSGTIGAGTTLNTPYCSWTIEEISGSNAGPVLQNTYQCTQAQRLALSATESTEVYQTDRTPDKFIYTQGAWRRITGLAYGVLTKSVNQSGVNVNSDVTWAAFDGFGLSFTPGSTITLGTGNWELTFSAAISYTNTGSGTGFQIVDTTNTALSGQSDCHQISCANPNGYSFSGIGTAITFLAAPTTIKVSCTSLYQGPEILRIDGTWLKIRQLD